MTPDDEKLIAETACILAHLEKRQEHFVADFIRTQQARIAELEGEKAALTEKVDAAKAALKETYLAVAHARDCIGRRKWRGANLGDTSRLELAERRGEKVLQRISKEG